MSVAEERERAFAHIYQAHYRAIAAYTRRRLSEHDADDAVAETFLVAWRRLDDIPSGDQTLPWLYGVARRVVSQGRRGGRRRDRLVNRLARFRHPDDVSLSDSDHVDVRDAVLTALATLRPGDQELLRLAEWEQVTTTDLARIFQCSTNAIAIRLHRAHKRFGQALRAVEDMGERIPERETAT
jgi:RNA polymerase sigma factor (sigma-70 family)